MGTWGLSQGHFVPGAQAVCVGPNILQQLMAAGRMAVTGVLGAWCSGCVCLMQTACSSTWQQVAWWLAQGIET
jgi:hypothetical protein